MGDGPREAPQSGCRKPRGPNRSTGRRDWGRFCPPRRAFPEIPAPSPGDSKWSQKSFFAASFPSASPFDKLRPSSGQARRSLRPTTGSGQARSSLRRCSGQAGTRLPKPDSLRRAPKEPVSKGRAVSVLAFLRWLPIIFSKRNIARGSEAPPNPLFTKFKWPLANLKKTRGCGGSQPRPEARNHRLFCRPLSKREGRGICLSWVLGGIPSCVRRAGTDPGGNGFETTRV